MCKKICLPELIIYKIHLGPNNMHESLWIDQYLYTFILNQLVKLPFLIYCINHKKKKKKLVTINYFYSISITNKYSIASTKWNNSKECYYKNQAYISNK